MNLLRIRFCWYWWTFFLSSHRLILSHWLILKIINQCEVKRTVMLPIKTIMSVLKVLTYIITSITTRPIRLTCDTSDDVFLDSQNCSYCIFIAKYKKNRQILNPCLIVFNQKTLLLKQIVSIEYCTFVSERKHWHCM